MVKTPIIQTQRHVDVSSTGFLIILRHWMGRLWSTCAQVPIHIYGLICKTEKTAQPIFVDYVDADKAPPSSPKKRSGHETPSPDAIRKEKQVKDAASPVLSPKNDVDILLDDDDEPSAFIVTSLFANMGFDMPQNVILKKGIVFNLVGEEQKGINTGTLSGNFQVEWNLSHVEDDFKTLIYKGNFQKGMIHGKGSFMSQDSNGTLHLLLDGQFNEGKFISGMLVMDNCYIEGTFINGEKHGSGTIHYIPSEEDEDDSEQIQYRGEFRHALPHGKGKMYLLASEGVKIISDGEFKDGASLRGRFQEASGDIFEGEFNKETDSFKGTIKNLAEKTYYEGECKDGQYAQGKLTSFESIISEQLEQNEGETDLVEISEDVQIIKTGEFRNNELYEGKLRLDWEDGKWSISNVKDFEIVDTIVHTTDGQRYEGQFDFATLDGIGTIYNSEGKEVYHGDIKCGVSSWIRETI